MAKVTFEMSNELKRLLIALAKKNKRKFLQYVLEVLACAAGRRDLAVFGNTITKQRAINEAEHGIELLRHNQATGWNMVFQAIRKMVFERDLDSAKKYSKALSTLFARGVKRNVSTETDIAAIQSFIQEHDTSIYLEKIERWQTGCPERAGLYALLRKDGTMSVEHVQSSENTAVRDESIEFCHLLSELPTSRR